MKITERRIVMQDWYEDEESKNGWSEGGWQFRDDSEFINESDWSIVNIIDTDKHYNPILAIAERTIEIM